MYDRKRRKTSELWNFFKPIDSVFATCNLCKMKLSFKTSTSNLKKHLQSKHPTVKVSRWINFPLVCLNFSKLNEINSYFAIHKKIIKSYLSKSCGASYSSWSKSVEIETFFRFILYLVSKPLKHTGYESSIFLLLLLLIVNVPVSMTGLHRCSWVEHRSWGFLYSSYNILL